MAFTPEEADAYRQELGQMKEDWAAESKILNGEGFDGAVIKAIGTERLAKAADRAWQAVLALRLGKSRTHPNSC